MEVTQIIREGDGFDSKDNHEFMHDVRQYYAYRSKQQKFQVVLGKLECFKNRSWVLGISWKFHCESSLSTLF